MKKGWTKKKFRELLAAGLVAGSVLFFRQEGISVEATAPVDIQDQIDNTQNQIDSTQNQINQAQNQIGAINDKIDSLSDEQDLIEEKIADIQAEIINTMASISTAEEAIEEKKNAIQDKEVQIDQTEDAYEEAKATADKQYDDMIQHIRYTYENGGTSYLDLLLSGDDFGNLLNRLDYIDQVYTYDQNMLDNYRAAQAQVKALWDQLETEKQQLQADKDQLEKEKEELENQRGNLKVMLAQRQKEADNYEEEIKRYRQQAAVVQTQMKQDQKDLERLRDQLATQQRQQAAGSSNANTAGGGGESGTGGETGGNTASEGSSSGGGNAASYGGGSGSSLGQQIADYACQFVGNPYVSGGTSLTNGADCSGFTYRVFLDFGYSIPRTSYAQRSAGTGVSYSDAQPGDIICYDGHVALYIGNGKIVHASTARTGIKISNANYREILAVRRIV